MVDNSFFWFLVGSVTSGIGVSCVWLYAYDVVRGERDRARGELRGYYEQVWDQQSQENRKWLDKLGSK